MTTDTLKGSYVCKGCGSKLAFTPGIQSLKCEYCGTTFQLTADYDQIPDTDQASLIVPMKVEEKVIELSVFEYMAGQASTPDDMIETSRIVKFERFYSPFYNFKGRYHGTWSASFGFERSEPYTDWITNGQGGRAPVTRYQTVTDWSPINGSLQSTFDVTGYAGSRLPENAALLIEGSKAIQDATSDINSYVAGIEVETFQKSERDVFAERAKGAVDSIIEADVMSNAQGDQQRDWTWQSDYEREAATILMPVCHAVFEYNQKTYDFWVDGADASRIQADDLPNDVDRENQIKKSFLPAKISAVAVAACWVWINNIQIRDPSVIYISTSIVFLAILAYGYIRRAALLDYSRQLKGAILSFQKASRTNIDVISEQARTSLLNSFTKPTRPWIANASTASITIPTLVGIAGVFGATIFVIETEPSNQLVITRSNPAPPPQIQRPAPQPQPPTSNAATSSSNKTNYDICFNALDASRSGWDQSNSLSRNDMAEASRRGLTIVSCRQIIGFSAASTSPSSSVPNRTVPQNPQSVPSDNAAVQLRQKSISGAPRTTCDDLAANPTDRRKLNNIQGASFGVLKLQATQAIAACETAAAEFPNELRFQYQLARALEHKDKDRLRAFGLHQNLVRLRYPAAFDNLGWMYFRDQKDPNTAVRYFRMGVELEDADSMISLADMIDRGHFSVANVNETKIALFKRAAELGHPNAAAALNAEMSKMQQSMSERESQQKMLEVFGFILRNIPNR